MNTKDLQHSAIDELRDYLFTQGKLDDSINTMLDAAESMVDDTVVNALEIVEYCDNIINEVSETIEFLIKRGASQESIIKSSSLILQARQIKERGVLIYNNPNYTLEAGC